MVVLWTHQKRKQRGGSSGVERLEKGSLQGRGWGSGGGGEGPRKEKEERKESRVIGEGRKRPDGLEKGEGKGERKVRKEFINQKIPRI